jgi:hypothetical protein
MGTRSGIHLLAGELRRRVRMGPSLRWGDGASLVMPAQAGIHADCEFRRRGSMGPSLRWGDGAALVMPAQAGIHADSAGPAARPYGPQPSLGRRSGPRHASAGWHPCGLRRSGGASVRAPAFAGATEAPSSCQRRLASMRTPQVRRRVRMGPSLRWGDGASLVMPAQAGIHADSADQDGKGVRPRHASAVWHPCGLRRSRWRPDQVCPEPVEGPVLSLSKGLS